MSTEKPKKIETDNRSMSSERDEGSVVFFFPKHTPPTSVRAATREEAERILEDTNKKEA